MFYSESPYSAFFTSGLLFANEHLSLNDSLRRGSLPVTINSRLSVNMSDDASAFYFSMQPNPNTKESRSFLSLDLAESSCSIRSASLKRKAQSISTVESAFGCVPAAKPIPSTELPAIPQKKVLSVNSYANSGGMFLPKFVPLRRHGTYNTMSTVSTRYRRVKRNDALARLEGRTRPPTPNFMCLDDDEDEGDWELVQQASPVDITLSTAEHHHQTSRTSLTTLIRVMMEDENIIVPSSPGPAEKASRASSVNTILTDSVPSPSSVKKRARASSWLPLRSFIDLEDGPGAAPWRSFIEISTLS